MPDEIERTQRIHKEVMEFGRIKGISDPMRELVEDLWPHLASKRAKLAPSWFHLNQPDAPACPAREVNKMMSEVAAEYEPLQRE